MIPGDAEERLALARRLVTDRCLYGVDKNALAVEMAKLSLWLVTLQKDRPFTFLDHALKCGDSLLGVTNPEQVEWFHLDSRPGRQLPLWGEVCATALRTATEKRRRLESFPVQDIRDTEEKARLLAEADQAMEPVRLIADLLIGAALSTAVKRASALDDTVGEIAARLAPAFDEARPPAERTRDLEGLRRRVTTLLAGRTSTARPRLHWALEFPEVFGSADTNERGFDAIVTNPPFLGGKRISGALGQDYREFLVKHLADAKKGHADLCAYFFLRAAHLIRAGGGLGMLATNTIAQGDTREVGLEQLVEGGYTIQRAVPSRKWPGTANLEVAHVWIRRGPWAGEHVLDDQATRGVTAFLTPLGTVAGKPYRLAANKDGSFNGSYVLGMGFVVTTEQAQELIARNPRNQRVLFPYLNGEDLNSRPDQSPSRWVINFKDWPLRRGAPGRWQEADAGERKKWLRDGIVPDDYSHPVAADYPDCLAIVETFVKPEREKQKDKGGRKLWWRFLRPRPELHAAIAGLDRVLVLCIVTHHVGFSLVQATQVFAHRLVVFPTSSYSHLALLQSNIHEPWARAYSSQLETRLNYSPSDCLETFPFPRSADQLESVGSKYHDCRRALMLSRGEGLTKIYNRVHNSQPAIADVRDLRDLTVAMDEAVAAAYGWTDLKLDHDFHKTKQGVRFTISERARQEVLARLLALNHERYADEMRRGLHERTEFSWSRDDEEEADESLFTDEEQG